MYPMSLYPIDPCYWKHFLVLINRISAEHGEDVSGNKVGILSTTMVLVYNLLFVILILELLFQNS